MIAERVTRLRRHRRRTRRLAAALRSASGAEGGVPGLAWLIVGFLALLAAAFIGGGAAATP